MPADPPASLDDTTLIITAWKRPGYLRRILASWVRAEGTKDLRRIVIALAPSPAEPGMRRLIAHAADQMGRAIEIRPDSPECARVPGPHRAIAEAANAVLADDPGCGFLVFSEEDTLVSDDVLSFITWGRGQAEGRALAVCAHNPLGNGWQRDAPDDTDADQAAARFGRSFSPWCWATWPDIWVRTLEPDWDYELNRGPRPDQHGYDWQLQRIVEREGDVLCPDAARSQNIGQHGGVFANPAEFGWTQAKSFRETRGKVTYRLEGAA